MKIRDILKEIERFAPLSYQEKYDNAGLQVGDDEQEATGAILCLDITEDVLEQAISMSYNLIIAHHPLIFGPLKRLTGSNYVERILAKAIKNDIALYAAHTNLDNMRRGVNHKIAQKLGLINAKILSPAPHKLFKLYTYVPNEHVDTIKNALFDAGAGQIGLYKECSFSSSGLGTFLPMPGSRPTIGSPSGPRETVQEVKLEFLVPEHLKKAAVRSLLRAHPYEEVAYELIGIENENQDIGAGMIANLPSPMPAHEFMAFLKHAMGTSCIRHTRFLEKPVETIAFCGGAGSFLLPAAMAKGADVFITGDYKYHQFFDADGKIVIADIGHYESEHFTVEIFSEILNEKFPNFAHLSTDINTNPVNYFI